MIKDWKSQLTELGGNYVKITKTFIKKYWNNSSVHFIEAI